MRLGRVTFVLLFLAIAITVSCSISGSSSESSAEYKEVSELETDKGQDQKISAHGEEYNALIEFGAILPDGRFMDLDESVLLPPFCLAVFFYLIIYVVPNIIDRISSFL